MLADAECFRWCEERAPRIFPGVSDRHAAGFKVTPAVCYVAPLVLPEDGCSDEQEGVLMEYVKRATVYVEQHVGLMLAVLENERRQASSDG